ncbi:MAG: serine protease [Candidatus Eremiobacteraeota bacterium]|nr:serine protease [Candidatus Eremiobacteraeota bacterium]
MKAWFRLLALTAFALPACSAHHADDDFVAAAARLQPSVVLLTMQVPGDGKTSKVDDAYSTGTVVASGAWGSDILTVQHAIDGAWNIHVTVGNKRKYPGRVVAQNSGLDIAVVRTSDPNMPVARLASAKDVQPGRDVGLLGYPIPDQFDQEGLGLQTSVNSGRVSSMRKDAIEVTLPIVPGESGSPVFLADSGEIIGMAESRFDEEHSIGFALSAEAVKAYLHKVDAEHGL